LLGTDADIRRALAGLKAFRAIGSAAPLAPLIAQELAPGPDCNDDASLERYIRSAVTTSYHPAGTCRMGRAQEPDAVVDARLRVHGIANLRVVDASVFPEPIGGNINAPVIALAERAADLILGRAPLAAEERVEPEPALA
jgi:choline dehydrogenase-like flavoprotein